MSVNITRCSANLWSGAESMAYELTSPFMSVTIADLGANLASVVLRLANNDEIEVSVGYPAGATTSKGYHGASVGRYANRIAGSRITVDGEQHELEPNEGPNQLHGGPEGFSAHAWSADAEAVDDVGRVVLKHVSRDGDQGFPGKVKATAIYELTDNQLRIDYRAKVNAPTPVNLTNHAYWNLGGNGRLEGHELTVAAAQYVPVDDANIPVAEAPVSVDDSRFDCRNGRDLAEVDAAGGFDHCFVLESDAQAHASLQHASGRRLDLVTNQIGLQVYTGLHLPDDHRGVALETQCLPDTPNRPDFGDCLVRPGDSYHSTTLLTFHS